MSQLENAWRARKFREAKDKQIKSVEAQQQANEIAKIEAEGKVASDLQQRGIEAQQDTAREKRINKFLGERRYGSLLEARGRDDPTVQQAGRELGYDRGGLATPKRAGALKQRGQTTSGGEVAPKYADVTKRMELADRIGPEAMEKLETKFGGKSSAKQESMASANVFGEEQPADDKIYQGTIQRDNKDYKYFTDSPGARPEGLQGGLKDFQANRFSSAAPTPTAASTMKDAMPDTYSDYGSLAEKGRQQETGNIDQGGMIKKIFREPAPKGQSTWGVLKQIGQMFKPGQGSTALRKNDPVFKDIKRFKDMIDKRKEYDYLKNRPF